MPWTFDDIPDLTGRTALVTGANSGIGYWTAFHLARRGAPKTPSELIEHDCLRLISPVLPLDKWLFDGPNGQEMITLGTSPFQVNVGDAMTEAISSGMGIAALPVYSAVDGLRNGSLVRVLPHYKLQQLNVYALYPSRQYLDAKIKTWVAYLRENLPGVLQADGAGVASVTP